MFNKARLKLTLWYLLIIMIISLSFSLFVYKNLTSELDRVEKSQRLRDELRVKLPEGIGEFQFRPFRTFRIDQEVIDETKKRWFFNLFLINLGILGFSSLAGYFLAGRTLRPIKEMIDEQNRFITDASHELRTPLTSLKSEIEVNLRDQKLDLKQSKKILESNLEEVNKLQYLSDNLIKLTQYQKMNANITYQKVEFAEVIKEAVRKVSKLANHKKIVIKTALAGGQVSGEKQSLVELLTILLDNAIKYSRGKSLVQVNSKVSKDSLEIKIKDQGVGINKSDIPYLFDRFYRVDKSRVADGYGLGLSIAKEIVEKHHGEIRVDSKVEKGTTFLIKLPLIN